MDSVGNWLKSFFEDKKNSSKLDQKAIEGFEYLIDREVIVIAGNVVYIYKKIWEYYPGSKVYWRESACRYLKANKKEPDLLTVYFKDMETGEDLDVVDCNSFHFD